MLNSLPSVARLRILRCVGLAPEDQLVNARPMYWLCVVQSVGHLRFATSRLFSPRGPSPEPDCRDRSTDSAAPHADSQSFFNDRVVCLTSPHRKNLRGSVETSACTHYLVFKEPAQSGVPIRIIRAPVAPGPRLDHDPASPDRV